MSAQTKSNSGPQISSDRSSADSQQTLAVERTDLARDRTLLAEERTYSAWVRTGLAAVATGFGIVKFIGMDDPTLAIRLLGAIFIIIGGVMFGIGFWAYSSTVRRLQGRTSRSISLWLIGSLSLGLLLGSMVLLMLIAFD